MIQWSCPKGSERSTISGRRLALPHEGGDADVAESGASHRLDSDMCRNYALHIHHKSKIAASLGEGGYLAFQTLDKCTGLGIIKTERSYR